MSTRAGHGLSIAEFEGLKREAAMGLLAHCDRFMVLDNQINESLVEISRSIANHIARQPEIFEGRESDTRMGSGLGGIGEDVTGAGIDWGAVTDVIDKISGILGHEKPFIQKIIEKIFDL